MNKESKFLILGLVLLVISVLLNIQLFTDKSSLELKNEKLNELIKTQVQSNNAELDSLNILAKRKDSVVTCIKENIRFQELKIDSLQKLESYNESMVTKLHDVDSIQSLFTRYYPSNN
ncbi:hypothetical protein Y10_01150 [Neptunitalea sp. Y10]|uniref:Uncharacterized protein n=1 Tax=Neptunitalea lumnitzerae TaxID=2965509 RepID=A0ABQ5MEE1_9FLAO|nr:hypothetical protein Y10_01150 [Neptunitalea sp. Y10]